MACLIGVFSLLGLPWVVGATVRSIAHVQSLFLYSPCTAPGERPKFLGVKEQRVTLLCMSILLGLSILMYQVLQVRYVLCNKIILKSSSLVDTTSCIVWTVSLYWSGLSLWNSGIGVY